MPSTESEQPGLDPPASPVEAFARSEAHRLAAQARLRADPARLAEGWERRFVIEGRRAEDCVRLYESLGFDVIADPVRAEDVAEDCTDCGLLAQFEFRMLYTRPRR